MAGPPRAELADEEAYVVFCLASDGPEGGPLRDASQWLADNRLDVAALLNQEADYRRLAVEEINDAVANPETYYSHDLVVMDWDDLGPHRVELVLTRGCHLRRPVGVHCSSACNSVCSSSAVILLPSMTCCFAVTVTQVIVN
jgi:hypothetical protein